MKKCFLILTVAVTAAMLFVGCSANKTPAIDTAGEEVPSDLQGADNIPDEPGFDTQATPAPIDENDADTITITAEKSTNIARLESFISNMQNNAPDAIIVAQYDDAGGYDRFTISFDGSAGTLIHDRSQAGENPGTTAVKFTLTESEYKDGEYIFYTDQPDFKFTFTDPS